MSLIRTPPIPESPLGSRFLVAIWHWISDRLGAIYGGRWS